MCDEAGGCRRNAGNFRGACPVLNRANGAFPEKRSHPKSANSNPRDCQDVGGIRFFRGTNETPDRVCLSRPPQAQYYKGGKDHGKRKDQSETEELRPHSR